jgi:hypothetical protein
MHLGKLRLRRHFYIAVLSAVLWIGLIAGCSVLERNTVPTPFPEDFIETSIKLTKEAGELSTSAAILNPSTPEATETPIAHNPTQIPDTPENTPDQSGEGTNITPPPPQTSTQPPVINPDSSLVNIPEAAIQITSPGPMSKISSLLKVNATLNTEPDGHMRIEVWLEPLTPEGEPRLLLRELQNFISDPTPRIFISKEFDVEISRVAEFGQLRVSTYDADNRMVALTSVDLLLLSFGDMEINPPGDLRESIVILEPGENELIQGGTAFVSGLVRSVRNQYLTINLTTPEGKVIGVQQIPVTPPPEGGYVPFDIEVPYYVSETTQVRISVYESIGRIPGITHLSSIVTLVSP